MALEKIQLRLRQLQSYESLLFIALLIAHLIPIGAFTYFPTQDGASHVYNASVMRDYASRAVYREYYLFSTDADPNLLGHIVLAILMFFVSALTAEKIFLSIYVLLLPISVRYTLGAIAPQAAFLSVLSFPFIYNRMLHFGFYNFSSGIPFFILLIGFLVKRNAKFTFRDTPVLAVLFLVLYIAHAFVLIEAVMAVGVLTASGIWSDLITSFHRGELDLVRVRRVFRERVLVLLCACTPSLLLVYRFVLKNGTQGQVSGGDIIELTRRLYHVVVLVSYDSRERLFSTALGWLFAGMLVYVLFRERERSRWYGPLSLVIAAYGALYFTVPDEVGIGGGLIKDRLSLFLFLAVILWFGAFSYGRAARVAIPAISIVITLALLQMHFYKYKELNAYLDEYLSGSNLVEPDTTLLAISFSPTGKAPDGNSPSLVIHPFGGAGYLAAQRHVVDMGNYEAIAPSGWPIRFRARFNPLGHIIWCMPGCRTLAPYFNFLNYSQLTGGTLDYVLLWDTGGKEDDSLAQLFRRLQPSIANQLESGYDLLYTSPEHGFMKLYRRKGWKSGGGFPTSLVSQ
jgi:hypothetical protein